MVKQLSNSVYMRIFFFIFLMKMSFVANGQNLDGNFSADPTGQASGVSSQNRSVPDRSKARTKGVGDLEEDETFSVLRLTDFTKILGTQNYSEGIKLNYTNEKSNVEGQFGKAFGDAFVLQLGGSLGSTTNLSSLFTQKVLPAFSINIGGNFLLRGASIFYYDGDYDDNFEDLKSVDNEITLDTINARASRVYNYKDKLRKDIQKGEHTIDYTLYTCKTFTWISTNLNYENNKYSFYDNSRPISVQQYDTTFKAFSAKVNFNHARFWNKADVRWSGLRPNFLFVTAFIKYGLINNINLIKKVSISDVSSSVQDTSKHITRQVGKTQTSYQGQYKELPAMSIGGEFIIAPVRLIALDFFGDYNLISNTDQAKFAVKNYATVGAGFYFYGDENKSKVNFGIFYKWTLNNDMKTNGDWVGQLGIKTQIPIAPLK